MLSLDHIAKKTNQTLYRNTPVESARRNGDFGKKSVTRTHSQKNTPQQKMRLRVQELKIAEP